MKLEYIAPRHDADAARADDPTRFGNVFLLRDGWIGRERNDYCRNQLNMQSANLHRYLRVDNVLSSN